MLCQPFFSFEYEDAAFTVVSTENKSDYWMVHFFVERAGLDSSTEWAIATVLPLQQWIQSLKVDASSVESNWKACNATTIGDGGYRPIAILRCPVEVKDRLELRLAGWKVVSLPMCGRVPLPARFAVTARPLNDNGIISRRQIASWVEHHDQLLAAPRFYLYDRPSSSLLESIVAHRPRVDLVTVPFISDNRRTFDAFVTRSYIFDQVLVMYEAFSRARFDGVGHLLSIDYDEYLRTSMPFAGAFALSQAKCHASRSIAVVRRNLVDINYDPESDFRPAASDQAHRDNVKSIFDVSEPEMTVYVHYAANSCAADPNSIWIHHLVDAYVPRSNSEYYRFGTRPTGPSVADYST